MRCSSWNWGALDYTYHECPGTGSPGGWDPSGGGAGTPPPPRHPVGVHIEDLLDPLPAGCRVVGRGPLAQGRIVRAPGFSVGGPGGVGGPIPPRAPAWFRIGGAFVALVIVAFGARVLAGPER